MSAAHIRATLERLREAHAKLRRRPAREIVDALACAIDVWRDPRSDARRALAAGLPHATGFSPETVREGLERGFGRWRGDDLRELVAGELGPLERLDATGPSMISAFPVTTVLLAGSIPMPSLLALVTPLVLRSPVLAKPAGRDPLTAAWIARSIAEVDSELGGCVEVVSFAGSDSACVEAALEADCVVAAGSDQTIRAVAARVRPPTRLVADGHRLSVAALGPQSAKGSALRSAAKRLALDVALWDQLGCLSPICVYVAPASEADPAAEALAEALAEAEARWPRGAVEPAAAAAIAHERAEAEMRAAAGRRVVMHGGEGTRWTVVREADARVRTAPLHRFLRVHPVRDAAELLDALAPLARYLAAVAVEGFGDETPSLARALADLGASRICPPGELQSPPLAWSHDNRPLLTPLARFGELEAPR